MDESDLFEREVRQLLSLQGWSTNEEMLLGHKKVDTLASKKGDFGHTYRIAVECKKYKKPLSQKFVSNVYANYLPLIQSNEVSYTLLVTENGLAPSAVTFVETAKQFRHVTKEELISGIMNFVGYSNILDQSFRNSNVAKYYVPQRISNSDELIESHILEWVNKPNAKPIAILGGYGMGKSTLANRLASVFARKYLDNPTSRIPILINLAEMVSESSLEGLLGKEFTSTNPIQNYSFRLFDSLNDMGRFVFLLDGFDEMKKIMSWDVLMANLEQLYRLFKSNSKMIILGRPSVFMDEREQQEALHGQTSNNLSNFEDVHTRTPDFREIEISSFSRAEILAVIENYTNSLEDTAENKGQKVRLNKVHEQLQAGESRLLKLSTRPVQLQMLMQILPKYKGDLSQITVSELYSTFIEMVMIRETSKEARRLFPLKARQDFTRKIAHFMWMNGQRREIRSHEIPSKFLEGFNQTKYEAEALKRQLLVGSIMERKGTEGYYFSHRSFQEYLMAEALYYQFRARDRSMLNISLLTAEIQGFFTDIMGKNNCHKFKRWADTIATETGREAWEIGNEPFQELLESVCSFHKITYKPDGKLNKDENDEKSRNLGQRLASTSIIAEEKDLENVKKKRRVKKGPPKKFNKSAESKSQYFKAHKNK